MNISLNVQAEAAPVFFQLLEQGFIQESFPGCSVRELICNQLGIDPRYLEDRIQTVFLDHKPVDDLDAAVLQKGSVLALSAAMPGLAGATLRKGGRFAALRKQISCGIQNDCRSEEKTQVTIKYFNMIARELGRAQFKRGVRLNGPNLNAFFNRHLDDIGTEINSAHLDGKEIDLHRLSEISCPQEVFLRILTD